MEQKVSVKARLGELSEVSGSLPAFDSLTRLAQRLCSTPIALVSLVQEEKNRQIFLSYQGLDEPWRSRGQTPLSHSMCQTVKQTSRPLIVHDAPNDPRFHDHSAVSDLGIAAYLGVPIYGADGTVLGALCVADRVPRIWSEKELSAVTEIAACVSQEIQLRMSIFVSETSQARSRQYNAKREMLFLAFACTELPLEKRFERLLETSCQVLGMKSGRISKGSLQTWMSFDPSGCFKDRDRSDHIEPLAKEVMSDCSMIYCHDLQACKIGSNRCPSIDGRYLGAPLTLRGILFGVVEFFDDQKQQAPWTEDDLSLLSIISMLTSSHLEVIDQIDFLKKCEMALLNQLAKSQKRRTWDATAPHQS